MKGKHGFRGVIVITTAVITLVVGARSWGAEMKRLGSRLLRRRWCGRVARVPPARFPWIWRMQESASGK